MPRCRRWRPLSRVAPSAAPAAWEDVRTQECSCAQGRRIGWGRDIVKIDECRPAKIRGADVSALAAHQWAAENCRSEIAQGCSSRFCSGGRYIERAVFIGIGPACGAREGEPSRRSLFRLFLGGLCCRLGNRRRRCPEFLEAESFRSRAFLCRLAQEVLEVQLFFRRRIAHVSFL